MRLQVEEAAGGIEPGLAESLQDELRRLSDYVDQCLLLATAEQGRLVLDIKPVALRALVTEMIEVYELLAREQNRRLTVSAPEEVTVSADARKLRQMLHNLLTNALRHGSGPLTVTVRRERDETVCRVENEVDVGPGASAGGGSRAPGAGWAEKAVGMTLGLRIVRALAGLHPGLVFTAAREGGRFVAELRWQ